MHPLPLSPQPPLPSSSAPSSDSSSGSSLRSSSAAARPRATALFRVLTLLPLGVLPLTWAAAQNPATTIDLTVTGGPRAGAYRATSEQVTCSYGLAAPGAWGNQYSIVSEDPAVFTSLQLIVPDAAAAASGSGEFLVTVAFGPLFGDGASYTIDTRPDAPQVQGQGSVAIADGGDAAEVVVRGTTADGVGIEATVHCHQVMRFEGDPAATTAAADAPAPEGATGAIRLLVGGTSYEVTTSDTDAACERDMAEEGDFYYAFYRDDGSDGGGDGGQGGLSSLELLAYDFEAALAGSPDFHLSVNDQTHYLDTPSGDGSGTVTIRRDGEHLVVTLDAVDDGAPVQATITCRLPAE